MINFFMRKENLYEETVAPRAGAWIETYDDRSVNIDGKLKINNP